MYRSLHPQLLELQLPEMWRSAIPGSHPVSPLVGCADHAMRQLGDRHNAPANIPGPLSRSPNRPQPSVSRISSVASNSSYSAPLTGIFRWLNAFNGLATAESAGRRGLPCSRPSAVADSVALSGFMPAISTAPIASRSFTFYCRRTAACTLISATAPHRQQVICRSAYATHPPGVTGGNATLSTTAKAVSSHCDHPQSSELPIQSTQTNGNSNCLPLLKQAVL